MSVSCGANGTQFGTTVQHDRVGWQFRLHLPRRSGQLEHVSVQVKDSDDANSNTATQTVTVANVAPTVTLTRADRRSTRVRRTPTASPSPIPGTDTFVLDATSAAPTAPRSARHVQHHHGAGSFDCTFPDGPATSTVSVTVSDSDGAADSDTLDVTVNNVKPSIVLTGVGDGE